MKSKTKNEGSRTIEETFRMNLGCTCLNPEKPSFAFTARLSAICKRVTTLFTDVPGAMLSPGLSGQPALLNCVADSCGVQPFEFVADDIRRLVHRKNEIMGHMNRGGPGLEFNQQDVLGVNQDFTSFIYSVEL